MKKMPSTCALIGYGDCVHQFGHDRPRRVAELERLQMMLPGLCGGSTRRARERKLATMVTRVASRKVSLSFPRHHHRHIRWSGSAWQRMKWFTLPVGTSVGKAAPCRRAPCAPTPCRPSRRPLGSRSDHAAA